MEQRIIKIWNSEKLVIKPLKDDINYIFEDIKRLKKPFWVSAGTLLGFFRDGDLIEGDTDVDIALEGFDGVENYILETFKDYEVVRTVHNDDKVMQIALYKNENLLDVYIHWVKGENLENIGESGITRMNKNILRNTELFPTKFGFLPFPKQTEKYLKIRYGADWQIKQDKKPIFYEI